VGNNLTLQSDSQTHDRFRSGDLFVTGCVIPTLRQYSLLSLRTPDLHPEIFLSVLDIDATLTTSRRLFDPGMDSSDC
jgi:hypothetical protein